MNRPYGAASLSPEPPISLPGEAVRRRRDLSPKQLALLGQVIESGTLNCTKGTQLKAFERAFAARLGVPYARAVVSGAAALHTAIAAINPEPGDEIITSAIADTGSIAPILYQQATPVFADVDSVTLNVTAESVAARISPRTRAIVATHFFGNPCDVVGIRGVAAAHGIAVIEDATQAFLATVDSRPVGTIGAIGAFSLQQGASMSTGDGGVVVTADPERERWMTQLGGTAWGYGEAEPGHGLVALSYRMTDLQSAAARVQLAKLDRVVARRRHSALRLNDHLAAVPGLVLPKPLPNATHVYWTYPLIVDPAVIRGGADALGARLNARGVFCVPRYFQKPAFECQVLRQRRTYGMGRGSSSSRARQDATAFRYDISDYPGAVRGLVRVLVLPWSETYTDAQVDGIADAVRAVVEELPFA